MIKFKKSTETLLKERHNALILAEQNGEITSLQISPTFSVQDAFSKNGVYYTMLAYNPPFAYINKENEYIIEDLKVQTEAHRILRTLFEYCYVKMKIKDIN